MNNSIDRNKLNALGIERTENMIEIFENFKKNLTTLLPEGCHALRIISLDLEKALVFAKVELSNVPENKKGE